MNEDLILMAVNLNYSAICGIISYNLFIHFIRYNKLKPINSNPKILQ